MIYISFHEPHKKFKILCSYRDILLIFLLLFCQIHLFHFSSLFYPLIYFFNACKENLWLSYVIVAMCLVEVSFGMGLEDCKELEGWDGLGEGREGSRGREHMYTCDWFMLMYGRNQHNIVKQLYFN